MSRLSNSARRVLSTPLGQLLKGPVIRAVARLGYQLVPLEMYGRFNLVEGCSQWGVNTVLDVGANQGQFGSRVRALGWSGPILSIEPLPDAFRLLKSLAMRNPPWDVFPVAAGSSSGEAVLNISQNSVSSSLLHPSAEHLAAAPHSKVVGSTEVQIQPLDSIVTQAGAQGPFMLKVDTQGYELEVLRGAPSVLDRTGIVQIEVSLRPLYDGQADWIEVIELLRAQSFRLVAIEPALVNADTEEVIQLDLVLTRASKVPSTR